MKAASLCGSDEDRCSRDLELSSGEDSSLSDEQAQGLEAVLGARSPDSSPVVARLLGVCGATALIGCTWGYLVTDRGVPGQQPIADLKTSWRQACTTFDQLYELPAVDGWDVSVVQLKSNASDASLCIASDAFGEAAAWAACDPVSPNQQWYLKASEGFVHSRWHQDRCLTRLPGGNVSLSSCLMGPPEDLRWERLDAGLGSGLALPGTSPVCLAAGVVPGPAHVEPCAAAPTPRPAVLLPPLAAHVLEAETLRWPSGPMHVRRGDALGPSGNGSWCLAYNAEALELERCDDCSPNQQWVMLPSGQIMTYWHQHCLTRDPRERRPPSLELCADGVDEQVWALDEEFADGPTFYGLCTPPMMPNYTEIAVGLAEFPASPLNCTEGLDDAWHVEPVAGWPDRGGVEPDPTLYLPFEVAEADVPPRLSAEAAACDAQLAAGNTSECGSEVLFDFQDPEATALLERLRFQIWNMTQPYEVVVHIGDDRGPFFRYGEEYRNVPVSIASEVKPITTVLALRLVELGALGLDDRVNRWLDFWPTEPSDSRSYITLRHCLSFTSGFYGVNNRFGQDKQGFPGEFSVQQDGHAFWNEKKCPHRTELECAKIVLLHTEHIAPPGAVWTYTGDHFRIAVAMLFAATGKTYHELVQEHIFSRTAPAMNSTRAYAFLDLWDPASRTWSTASDYQRFLDAYFRGQLVSRASMQVIEGDSQINTRVRYFKGNTREGRPFNHGLFGLGWWRTLSNRTLCGLHGLCNFAPSHFASMAAVDRRWPEFLGQQVCDWQRSSSCSYYFHFQNVNFKQSKESKAMFREIGHLIENYTMQLLTGRQYVNLTDEDSVSQG